MNFKLIAELREAGKTLQEIHKTHYAKMNFETFRKKVYRHNKKSGHVPNERTGEAYEILLDGTHKSDKLLRLDAKQMKNPEYLLKAHGFDPDEWELMTARNNIWNSYSKQDGIMTLYSSKITAKPSKVKSEILKMVESFKPDPIVLEKPKVWRNRLLEIPLFDLHFGIADFDHYEKALAAIVEEIEKGWSVIVISTGSDLFHNNDNRGNTANGTPIEKVDNAKAWESASKLLTTMLSKAIENSAVVKCVYIKGNHDETLAWAFAKYLEGLFPQVEHDTTFVERKRISWEGIFIAYSHGDKGGKRIPSAVINEWPMEWAMASTKEIHLGHFHRESRDLDVDGTMVRTLPTGNVTDQWHYDNGWVCSNKRFQLFMYDEKHLDDVKYIYV